MGKIIICEDCKEEKEHRAHNLCNACYIKEYRRTNPRTTISGLREELESGKEQVASTINSILRNFDVTCSYSDGVVVIDVQGQTYKVMVE